MIEVSGLCKFYGTKKAVNNISFNINKGDIVGFLGPNGAGKSTTMNMLTGYISSTAGKILINGFDILENPKEAKKCIGYLPELPPLYPDMTVTEYLDFVYELKGVTLPKKDHINSIMEEASISHVSGRLIGNLSKGYKQRVGLAQALIGDPEILILDEPTIGLDPAQIIEIRNVIKKLNKTIIFSSHILPEISAVCKRIIIINNGKIVAEGTNEDLSRSLSGGNRYTVQIEGEAEKVQAIVQSIEGVTDVALASEIAGGAVYNIEAEKDIRRELFYTLSENRMPVLALRNSELTLEEIFMNTVSGGITK